MSQLFVLCGQSIGVSDSAQSFQWIFRVDFLLNWLVWSPWSPWCPGDSQESSPTPQFENSNSSAFSLLYSPTLTCIHDYWKNYSFDYTDFVGKVTSLLFNMLCRLVIAFLPRRKWILILWLQSLSLVIWEPKKTLWVSEWSHSVVSDSLWPHRQ